MSANPPGSQAIVDRDRRAANRREARELLEQQLLEESQARREAAKQRLRAALPNMPANLEASFDRGFQLESKFAVDHEARFAPHEDPFIEVPNVPLNVLKAEEARAKTVASVATGSKKGSKPGAVATGDTTVDRTILMPNVLPEGMLPDGPTWSGKSGDFFKAWEQHLINYFKQENARDPSEQLLGSLLFQGALAMQQQMKVEFKSVRLDMDEQLSAAERRLHVQRGEQQEQLTETIAYLVEYLKGPNSPLAMTQTPPDASVFEALDLMHGDLEAFREQFSKIMTTSGDKFADLRAQVQNAFDELFERVDQIENALGPSAGVTPLSNVSLGSVPPVAASTPAPAAFQAPAIPPQKNGPLPTSTYGDLLNWTLGLPVISEQHPDPLKYLTGDKHFTLSASAVKHPLSDKQTVSWRAKSEETARLQLEIGMAHEEIWKRCAAINAYFIRENVPYSYWTAKIHDFMGPRLEQEYAKYLQEEDLPGFRFPKEHWAHTLDWIFATTGVVIAHIRLDHVREAQLCEPLPNEQVNQFVTRFMDLVLRIPIPLLSRLWAVHHLYRIFSKRFSVSEMRPIAQQCSVIKSLRAFGQYCSNTLGRTTVIPSLPTPEGSEALPTGFIPPPAPIGLNQMVVPLYEPEESNQSEASAEEVDVNYMRSQAQGRMNGGNRYEGRSYGNNRYEPRTQGNNRYEGRNEGQASTAYGRTGQSTAYQRQGQSRALNTTMEPNNRVQGQFNRPYQSNKYDFSDKEPHVLGEMLSQMAASLMASRKGNPWPPARQLNQTPHRSRPAQLNALFQGDDGSEETDTEFQVDEAPQKALNIGNTGLHSLDIVDSNDLNELTSPSANKQADVTLNANDAEEAELGSGTGAVFNAIVRGTHNNGVVMTGTVLLDSGAGKNFIDKDVAKQLDLEIYPLETPLKIHSPLGTTLASDAVRVAVSFVTEDGHPCTDEFIECVILPNLGKDLILGKPWCVKFGFGFVQGDHFKAHLSYPQSAEYPEPGRRFTLDSRLQCRTSAAQLTVLDHETDTSELVLVVDDAGTKKRLKELLQELEKVAPVSMGQEPPSEQVRDAHGLVHEVNTGDSAPVRRRAYAASPAQRKAIEDFITEGLSTGLIRPSNSSWSSPVVPVPKGTGYRICIDFRNVNAVTVIDAHSLPRTDEVLDALQGSTVFTTLDLKSGYHQVRMAENSIEKTAFVCHRGLFEYLKMPFGLTNAPATFQRLMNRVLLVHRDYCLVFVDDIVIHSKTIVEHWAQVLAVLKSLNEAHLVLNVPKCQWFRPEVKFLGHIVSAEGVRPNPELVEKIINLSLPKTIKELQRAINMVNYYRKFIVKIVDLQLPLLNKLKLALNAGIKPIPALRWTDEEKAQFRSYTQAITRSPCLALPDTNRRFIIDTDASEFAVGGVLQQEHPTLDGTEIQLRPIAFEHAKLKPAEVNYSAQERELHAIAHCLIKWMSIIEGCSIVVRTDHRSLEEFRKNKLVLRRLAKYLSIIEHFNAHIIYVAGSTNVVADALSRLREAGDAEEEKLSMQLHEMLFTLGFDTSTFDEADDDLIAAYLDEHIPAILGSVDIHELSYSAQADNSNDIIFYDSMIDHDFSIITHGIFALDDCFYDDVSFIFDDGFDFYSVGLMALEVLSWGGSGIPRRTNIAIASLATEEETTAPETPTSTGGKTDVFQLTYPEIKGIIQYLHGNAELPSSVSRELVSTRFLIKDGLLHIRFDKTMVPVLKTLDFVTQAKALHQQAHFSIGTLTQLVRPRGWHPDERLLLLSVIRECGHCQMKVAPPSLLADMTPLPPVPAFFRWGIDFVGPIAAITGHAPSPYKYLCTAIEYVTGFAYAIPVDGPTAQAALSVVSQICINFGPPKELITDNGAAFISHEMKAYLSAYKILQKVTTPYHPQTNGKCERFNGIIKTLLYHARNQNPTLPWHALMPGLMMQYLTRQDRFGYSPAYLAFALEGGSEASYEEYQREPTEDEDAEAVHLRVMQIEALAKEREQYTQNKHEQAQVRSKKQEDKAWLQEFEKGDFVMRVRERQHKFEPFYDGPFVVCQILGPNVYKLMTLNGVVLKNSYNSARLRAAYTLFGHPVDTPWYVSKQKLELFKQAQYRAQLSLARR